MGGYLVFMAEHGVEMSHAGLRLCDFIQGRQPAILREWERRARGLPVAERLQGVALRDHIPQILERLSLVLRNLHTGGEETLEELPDKHALARLDEGFDLRTAAEELSALRDTILELWEQEVEGTISVREVRQLDQAIDEIIAASVARFAQARERTLRALDRVSSAALGTGDLDTFLTQARVGGIPLSPRWVDLGELARQVLEEVQSAYPERRMDLRVGAACPVEGDPDRLAQVMANLMGNAVQHSPSDTPVRVTVRQEAEAVLFEVHNAGVPIAAEQLSGLFEPFQRGREARARAGGSLGLGLFISRQIVEAHGGRIEVRSAEGAGTTFTVWLPYRPRS